MQKKKAVMAMISGACMLFLSACSLGQNNSEQEQKQVPIYEGMTISTMNAAEVENEAIKHQFLKNVKPYLYGDKDNGNHYGHYKGDYIGRDEDFDKRNPFPDNGDDETLEEEIDDTLSVEGTQDTIYYAEQNQDIYIHIHIHNPDNFEILSFTLNNQKYSSYMFEYGSDMETLILKYNVGEEAGYTDYTIDAIKYVDTTEIKDVKMEGDKTVKVGIRTEDQIETTVSNMTVGINDLSFNVSIEDKDALIEHSQGKINAVLYDGETIIENKDLTVGDNQVHFENLQANTLYQYAIVGYYDNLAGNGFGANILYKDALYTEAIVLFDEIVIGQETIDFNLVWNSSISNQTLTALKLYNGETVVTVLDTATQTVNELLSGCAYTLVAEFDYLGGTERISLDFTTLTKQTPTLEILEVGKTSSSIAFDIIETDIDNICEIVKIEVLHEEDAPIVIDNLETREVGNLIIAEYYTIKVYYAYDLNDGNGSVEASVETKIKTKGSDVPMKEGTFTIINDYGFYHNQTLNNYYVHEGIDFGAAVGTNVYAFEDGVIESIYRDDVLLGTEIIISHANGLKSVYRFVNVAENIMVGDSVSKGQLIATVAEANGNEYKDGPHLHFEMIEDGTKIDPRIYLELE